MKTLFRPPGARRKSLFTRTRQTLETHAHHGYFESFDGTRLFYSSEGEGLPLIFCYGLVCSSLHWTYQMDHFRHGYRTIWFDYRGHQNSDMPKDLSTLSLESLAKDLGCLMDELKIPEAVILGHSMGVNVVLEFYRRNPHRVKGLVLANGTPTRPLESILNNNLTQKAFQGLRWATEKAPKVVDRVWKLNRANPIATRIVGLLGFNPHLTPKEDVQLYLDQISDLDPRVFTELVKSYENLDETSWLHEVQAPTLLIAGERDFVIPLDRQELMHQLLPKSRFEVIHHGSHCPQMDLPELVNSKIESFLEDIQYPRTQR